MIIHVIIVWSIHLRSSLSELFWEFSLQVTNRPTDQVSYLLQLEYNENFDVKPESFYNFLTNKHTHKKKELVFMFTFYLNPFLYSI